MRVTPRDVALLENIGRLRLASAAQLAALDGGSAQNVSRSLLALWENGYVERPEAQAASRLLYEGSRPVIYGLTRKGAALLRQYGRDVRRRLLDGIDKERDAGWRFVEHTVSIAEFMVRLEVALRGRDDLRILERGEILEDAPKSKRDRLVKIEASIRIGGALRKNAVIPDALFGLRFNDDEESYFMLEIDRGEMPVERYKNAQRTYFAKKMMTYYEANRQQRHVHDLGTQKLPRADGDDHEGAGRANARGARWNHGRARIEYVLVRRSDGIGGEQSARSGVGEREAGDGAVDRLSATAFAKLRHPLTNRGRLLVQLATRSRIRKSRRPRNWKSGSLISSNAALRLSRDAHDLRR